MKHPEIMRRRLRNTRLSGTPFGSPEEAVRWHGAMQAQDYGPAKWSLGQRTDRLVDEDMDRAFDEGAILRTHALRPTWHFIAGDDFRWVLALTGPRVHRQVEPRLRQLGLDARTLARCEALIGSLLEGGDHLVRSEIAEALDQAGIDRSGQRLPYILLHCELEGLICSGRLAGKQHTFALVDERAPSRGTFDRDAALVELVRRYLNSHGPATVKDLRWWSGLTMADIKTALDALGSEVQTETLEDMTLFSVAADPGRPPPLQRAHLLQMLDEAFVGYTESRHFGDARADDARAAWAERGMPAGIVLLRGRVAGHWRRTIQRSVVAVELLLYENPAPVDARAMESAARRLGRFLGLAATMSVSTI